jgi:NAD(P)H-hydrate epimerase
MDVDTFTSWRAGVTPQQMREIDRLAEERYGITSLQLMEVAGLAVARVARRLLPAPIADRAIVVLVGPGNNGGDGLVAARRLVAWGAQVAVFSSYGLDRARGLSVAQVEQASAAGAAVEPWEADFEGPDAEPGDIEEVDEEDEVSADASDLASYDLVIDALLGFGSEGPPREPIAQMIAAANLSRVPILAVDVPSGLDAGSGGAADPSISAAATCTLALPKTGLLDPGASARVGRLFLADIGVPIPLLADVGVEADGLFVEDDIIEIG